MSILQALILGIIQGLTEFLPISSSGHLVIFQKLFGLKQGVLIFDVAVHLATLIAVFYVFRKDIWAMLKKPFSKMPLLIVVGTIPFVIVGALFYKLIEGLFESGVTLGFEFLLTGLVLLYAEKAKNRNKKLEETTFTDATIIGTAQAIAMLPAVSRSGLTIAGALFRGLNREFAAKFSFLLSIPAILAAAALDILKLFKGTEAGVGALPLAVGMAAAAVSGYFAIRFMLKVLTKGSLKIFSYYVFIVGLLVIFDQLFFGRFFPKFF